MARLSWCMLGLVGALPFAAMSTDYTCDDINTGVLFASGDKPGKLMSLPTLHELQLQTSKQAIPSAAYPKGDLLSGTWRPTISIPTLENEAIDNWADVEEFGSLPAYSSPHVQQQSPPTGAINEIKQIALLQFSRGEQARMSRNSGCDSAFNRLESSFQANRDGIGFWPDRAYSLPNFTQWFYAASSTQRAAAQPVVHEQEAFAEACLESRIPDELNPPLIAGAVGLLMAGDKVICTGLRVSNEEFLTARHCFLDPATGRRFEETEAVARGSQRMWVAFESTPSDRFGVCRASVPASTFQQVDPSTDAVRVRIRPPPSPAVAVTWSSLPITTGRSLYLRGYFPFVRGASGPLSHLRSTAAGGCIAHSGVGRCFFHACQTTPIMSGAPIFVRPEPGAKTDHLEVAGIHLGPALISDPNGPNGEVCAGANGMLVPSSNFGFQP